MNNRKSTTYNKVVNIAEDGEISILEETFEYEGGFKGAVGTRFYPLSKGEVKRNTTIEAVMERLDDCFSIEDINMVGYVTYREYAKDIIKSGEAEDFMYNLSYRNLWDTIREQTGIKAYMFNCVGGGRMFDKNYNGNVSPELNKIIQQFES